MKSLLPLMLIVAVTAAHAEQYESCHTHPSAEFLDGIKQELDIRKIPNINMAIDGHMAVCVPSRYEKQVLKISREMKHNRI